MSKDNEADGDKKLKTKKYEKELRKLQGELCVLQDWVKHKGLRVIIIFEGRDGAGKGGTIRALTERVRQWKLSPMDLPSRTKWFEYSRARDIMLKATDTKWAPWYILRSDEKKRARLNGIRHILNLIPYKKVPREKIELPKRSMKGSYDDQAALKGRKFVAEKY